MTRVLIVLEGGRRAVRISPSGRIKCEEPCTPSPCTAHPYCALRARFFLVELPNGSVLRTESWLVALDYARRLARERW